MTKDKYHSQCWKKRTLSRWPPAVSHDTLIGLLLHTDEETDSTLTLLDDEEKWKEITEHGICLHVNE